MWLAKYSPRPTCDTKLIAYPSTLIGFWFDILLLHTSHVFCSSSYHLVVWLNRVTIAEEQQFCYVLFIWRRFEITFWVIFRCWTDRFGCSRNGLSRVKVRCVYRSEWIYWFADSWRLVRCRGHVLRWRWHHVKSIHWAHDGIAHLAINIAQCFFRITLLYTQVRLMLTQLLSLDVDLITHLIALFRFLNLLLLE